MNINKSIIFLTITFPNHKQKQKPVYARVPNKHLSLKVQLQNFE